MPLSMRGIRRTLGTAKTRKAPATAERLLAMAANTGAGLKGIRDRALLLLGFAGAFRRSELVALDLDDLEETPDGMKITIRHSKTDQEGIGQTIAVPPGKIACPVAALKEWIAAAGIQTGAIFRSVNRHSKVGERLTGQSVSDIVKEHAKRLRLTPSNSPGTHCERDS
jgi:site-specific recombinase XerD